MGFRFRQKIIIKKGFYQGYEGRILEDQGHKNEKHWYKIQLQLPNDEEKKTDFSEDELRPKTFWDYIIP